MKKAPKSRKRIVSKAKKPKIWSLPSSNIDMENFLDTNREKISEFVADVIGYGVDKNLSGVEVFLFDKSDYLVIISKKDFRENLNHIMETSLKSENYELCGRVHAIIQKMCKPKFSKKQVLTNLIEH
jgi:hypothetical protein